MGSILLELQSQLPGDAVIPGDDIEPRYMGDAALSADPDVRPLALVRPRTTEEVSLVLRLCNAQGCPVVTQGGRTGLAGGATPSEGAVILSLERMRALSSIDPDSATIQVEAGAILQNIQAAAQDAKMLFPLDIGARGSCTIGGNIATNAGGTRVLRYGMMRELVLGLEVVLADGTVVSALNSMLKNNSGYDLKQMFIGSEGTLGVVTRAVLRLFPRPTNTQTALCAVADFSRALELLRIARLELGSTLSAFEVMWPNFYRVALRGGHRPPLPIADTLYVLIELMGTDAEHDADRFEAVIGDALTGDVVVDALIAQSERERGEIWSIRDAPGEFHRTLGPNVGFDVALPITRIGLFVEECSRRLAARWPDADCVFFGHAADSNIHINVRIAGVDVQPEAEINAIVYACVEEYGGAVSAEHGIGLLKRAYLCNSRSADEINLMRRFKTLLDVKNILNPGKVL